MQKAPTTHKPRTLRANLMRARLFNAAGLAQFSVHAHAGMTEGASEADREAAHLAYRAATDWFARVSRDATRDTVADSRCVVNLVCERRLEFTALQLFGPSSAIADGCRNAPRLDFPLLDDVAVATCHARFRESGAGARAAAVGAGSEGRDVGTTAAVDELCNAIVHSCSVEVTAAGGEAAPPCNLLVGTSLQDTVIRHARHFQDAPRDAETTPYAARSDAEPQDSGSDVASHDSDSSMRDLCGMMLLPVGAPGQKPQEAVLRRPVHHTVASDAAYIGGGVSTERLLCGVGFAKIPNGYAVPCRTCNEREGASSTGVVVHAPRLVDAAFIPEELALGPFVKTCIAGAKDAVLVMHCSGSEQPYVSTDHGGRMLCIAADDARAFAGAMAGMLRKRAPHESLHEAVLRLRLAPSEVWEVRDGAAHATDGPSVGSEPVPCLRRYALNVRVRLAFSVFGPVSDGTHATRSEMLGVYGRVVKVDGMDDLASPECSLAAPMDIA